MIFGFLATHVPPLKGPMTMPKSLKQLGATLALLTSTVLSVTAAHAADQKVLNI